MFTKHLLGVSHYCQCQDASVNKTKISAFMELAVNQEKQAINVVNKHIVVLCKGRSPMEVLCWNKNSDHKKIEQFSKQIFVP